MVKVFVGVGLAVVVLAIGLVVAIYVGAQDEDTQCFASFSSANVEKAAAEGRAAGFDVSHQSGNEAGALIFETGKTGDDATPLEDSFDRIVRQNHGQFGGSCVEKGAFD